MKIVWFLFFKKDIEAFSFLNLLEITESLANYYIFEYCSLFKSFIMKKNKIVLYGAIASLALLLYFKFGKKKTEKRTVSGGGGGAGGQPVRGGGLGGFLAGILPVIPVIGTDADQPIDDVVVDDVVVDDVVVDDVVVDDEPIDYQPIDDVPVDDVLVDDGGAGAGTVDNDVIDDNDIPAYTPSSPCDIAFTNYYDRISNTFNWNGGNPIVTKIFVAYAMATGSPESRNIIDNFNPITSSITVDDFKRACSDHKSGNYSNPPDPGVGILPSEDDIPDEIIPDIPILSDDPVIEDEIPIKPPIKPIYVPDEPVEPIDYGGGGGGGSGDIDGGHIVDEEELLAPDKFQSIRAL